MKQRSRFSRILGDFSVLCDTCVCMWCVVCGVCVCVCVCECVCECVGVCI